MEQPLELTMEVATVGILKEIRRVSDPDKAQIIWDGIKVKNKTKKQILQNILKKKRLLHGELGSLFR